MLITHWRNVLDTLQQAAVGNPTAQSDILQLRGLAEQEDLEAFLPLRPDEVTDSDMPRRILNYIELIDTIFDKLCNMGIADSRIPGGGGVNATATYHPPSIDRYLYLLHGSGRSGALLGIPYTLWRDSGGITPLWLRFDTGFFPPGNFDNLDAVFDVFKDLRYGSSSKFLPIRLTFGVERERVIEDAVKQIQDIIAKLVPSP